jgi:hypothetical protein
MASRDVFGESQRARQEGVLERSEAGLRMEWKRVVDKGELGGIYLGCEFKENVF